MSDEFLLDSVLTQFMEGKYELYATWMGLAWSGVPLMFLNDNYYAVASFDGSSPNWGQVIWALPGAPAWCFVIWILLWEDLYHPVPAAKATLDGYGSNRIYMVDPAARKRLESRSDYN